MNSYNSPTTKPLFRGTQIAWYLVSLLEVALAFRFLLKLTGANPEAGFTNFIYGSTSFLTAPFSAVFPRMTVEGAIFEWTTLLAMVVYWIAVEAITGLLLMSRTVSRGEAAAELKKQDE